MTVFEKKIRENGGILFLEVEGMLSKNAANLFFNPGCALRLYRPDSAFGEDEITRSIMEEYDYLKNRFSQEEQEMEKREREEIEKKEEFQG